MYCLHNLSWPTIGIVQRYVYEFIICPLYYDTVGPAKTGDINLIKAATDNRNYRGRVNVFTRGDWYNICGTEFYSTEANVICQQLGFGKASSFNSNYGLGLTGRVITNLYCSGYELSITQCQYELDNISTNGSCQASNVIGVTCDIG